MKNSHYQQEHQENYQRKLYYQNEFEIASSLARQAGKAILDVYFGTMDKMIKNDGTPVTNADLQANEIIVRGLEAAFPKDGIVSEEKPSAGQQLPRVWYIDPLDGTRGFTERSDQFAVHIGLADKQQPVLGIVYKPTTGEMYYGIAGQGAYRRFPNGVEEQLLIKPIASVQPLLMQPSIVVDKQALQQSYWPRIEELFQPERVMVSGSEGLRIVKIAENIADLHFSNNPTRCSTWDVCAPHAIVQEAGAYVRYVDGTPILYEGQRQLGKYFLVARDQILGEEARKKLETIMA